MLFWTSVTYGLTTLGYIGLLRRQWWNPVHVIKAADLMLIWSVCESTLSITRDWWYFDLSINATQWSRHHPHQGTMCGPWLAGNQRRTFLRGDYHDFAHFLSCVHSPLKNLVLLHIWKVDKKFSAAKKSLIWELPFWAPRLRSVSPTSYF